MAILVIRLNNIYEATVIQMMLRWIV